MDGTDAVQLMDGSFFDTDGDTITEQADTILATRGREHKTEAAGRRPDAGQDDGERSNATGPSEHANEWAGGLVKSIKRGFARAVRTGGNNLKEALTN